jgi:hypothetical protein
VTSSAAGIVNYAVTCTYPGGVGQAQAQASVTYMAVVAQEPSVPAPSVTLSAASTTGIVGQALTLSWTSNNATQCAVSGGNGGDGWTGIVATSGTQSVIEAAAGTVTYGIACSGAPPAASAQVSVTFSSASGGGGSGGGTGSGGGGGGGSMTAGELWLLSLALLLQQLRSLRWQTRAAITRRRAPWSAASPRRAAG